MAMEPAPTSLTHGVEEIVSSIFENMLGLSTRPSGLDPATEIARNAPREVHSSIKLTGSWQGIVSIECTRLQARQFAARFLSLPKRQIDDRIARDVLGELTNMVAGNLKPLFASDIHLSVATVSSNNSGIADFNRKIRMELSFCSEEGNFAVKVSAAPAHLSNPCCPQL